LIIKLFILSIKLIPDGSDCQGFVYLPNHLARKIFTI